MNRTNFKGLPIVREMFTAMKKLYKAEYYGYVNSDILLSPSLFSVLSSLSSHYEKNELSDGVFLL